MQHECITEAASIEEAVDAALEQLGVQQDAVQYEVLDGPGKKLFGFGSEKSARVRVWIKEEYVREIESAKQTARDILEVEDEVATEQNDSLPPELASRETPELSDEDLDKVADTAVGILKEVLLGFGIDATVEEYEGDEGEIILDVVGGDVAVLIGRHGRTLEALQALVSAMTNRKLDFRYPVVVDVEGYRHRRRQKLEEIARKTADRVSRQGNPVRMRPMNAYERRVVHVALRNDRRVVTASEGEDPFRSVVVKPK